MDYLALAQSVAERAAAAGAAAEAYIETGVNTQIQIDRQQVEKLSYSGSKGLGLRVIQDGRMGYAYTSDFGDDAIAHTIATA